MPVERLGRNSSIFSISCHVSSNYFYRNGLSKVDIWCSHLNDGMASDIGVPLEGWVVSFCPKSRSLLTWSEF